MADLNTLPARVPATLAPSMTSWARARSAARPSPAPSSEWRHGACCTCAAIACAARTTTDRAGRTTSCAACRSQGASGRRSKPVLPPACSTISLAAPLVARSIFGSPTGSGAPSICAGGRCPSNLFSISTRRVGEYSTKILGVIKNGCCRRRRRSAEPLSQAHLRQPIPGCTDKAQKPKSVRFRPMNPSTKKTQTAWS